MVRDPYPTRGQQYDAGWAAGERDYPESNMYVATVPWWDGYHSAQQEARRATDGNHDPGVAAPGEPS